MLTYLRVHQLFPDTLIQTFSCSVGDLTSWVGFNPCQVCIVQPPSCQASKCNVGLGCSKDTESKTLCSFYQKKPSRTLDLACQQLSVNTTKSPYKQAYYLSKQKSTKTIVFPASLTREACLCPMVYGLTYSHP